MRTIFRFFTVFLFTVIVVGVSYGAGFQTSRKLNSAGLLARFMPAVSPQPGAPPKAGQAPAAGKDSSLTGFALYWDALAKTRAYAATTLPADKEITYATIRGSLKALDDPFTAFSDPDITAIQRPELEGEFEGIGAYVGTNREGQLTIQTPMRGQPAEKAGVKAGDVVIKVDDTDISKMDLDEAILLIRGPKGTPVRLTILRKGEPKPLVISVVRAKIDVPSVNNVRLLDKEGFPEVGYVELTVFGDDTTGELVDGIDELKQKGARALVLDLRNNPGGFLNVAIEVASQFIGDGIVVMEEDNKGTRDVDRVVPGGHALDMPLAVLVNGGSASASEIVAGAIQDHKRGILVGEKTFGKGSVQNVHELTDKSQLRVTVAAWLTPNGRTIHKKGIEPDVAISDTLEAELSDAANGETPTPTPSPTPPAEGAEEGPSTDPQLLRAALEAQKQLAEKGR